MSRPWNEATPCPHLKPDVLGQFNSFDEWVNHATSALTGFRGSLGNEVKLICIDNLGRRCSIGHDFQRARDEGAFPIRYFIEMEHSPPLQRLRRILPHNGGERQQHQEGEVMNDMNNDMIAAAFAVTGCLEGRTGEQGFDILTAAIVGMIRANTDNVREATVVCDMFCRRLSAQLKAEQRGEVDTVTRSAFYAS